MREYLVDSLFSLLSASGLAASSFHDNAGVLQYVNPRIGTYGTTPNGNGGMIPSVSPPFGMTRWTPQTRENFISQCPYGDADRYIHGFQATHQPAIWMGESGQVVLSPGTGDVEPLFTRRAHRFRKDDEASTPYVYEVLMDAKSVEAGLNATESIYSPVPGGGQPLYETVENPGPGEQSEDQHDLPAHADLRRDASDGKIRVAMTATSHVGHLKVDFLRQAEASPQEPYIFIQATRANWTGDIHIDPAMREISGRNPQRQDWALGPSRAPGFSGYFVSRFSRPFASYGITHGNDIENGISAGVGEHLGAYVKFDYSTDNVEVRTALSFVSVEQARRNLELGIPDEFTMEKTVGELKNAWLEKLGRIEIEGVEETDSDHDQRTIFYTALFHAMQYPNDFSEPLTSEPDGPRTFYSGYTDSVHGTNESYYQSWSIWDTFRAEHDLLTLFAPERINGMMRSLLTIFDMAGRLPMWANIVETNIMIGTHVDAVFANALTRDFCSFDIAKAWEAVHKNAFKPPEKDEELFYYDREPYTPDEVRAGLTSYASKGYVANDQWSEAGSRTLDYAFDDFAASVVAEHAGDNETAQLLHTRSLENFKSIYNPQTGFMQARNADGSWAPLDQGWTEGDAWIYTFAVPHDPRGLAKLLGGAPALKAKLDAYFKDGHNEHSNEPSHHSPYLYAALGYPESTQKLIRELAKENYNATSAGLSGNEDLGQMSAWYIFSALGFYPLNPASTEYVVGSPFFEKATIRLPAGVATGGEGGEERQLVFRAPGAATKPYVKGVKVDGVELDRPVLEREHIVSASEIFFEMAAEPQIWGQGGM